MDVSISYLGGKYQNLWEDKADNKHQRDRNLVFFLHAEAVQQVVRKTHRIHTKTMQRYASFIKFEVDMHNINLLPIKGPSRKIHQAIFVVTNYGVDTIVKLWLKEWHVPLPEPIPEENNVEEPPIHQVHDE